MSKYHINPETGIPGVCKAKKQCRFGDITHFDSKESAQKAYEAEMSQDSLTTLKKEKIEEVAPVIYDIPYHYLNLAQSKVDKANKKAQNAGISERFTLQVEKYEVESVENGYSIFEERAKLTLNRPEVKHDGWTFAGTMDWDAESGLITRMAPDQKLLERPQEGFCDVCKTTRHRSNTYIIQKDNEQKQVGSACLKKFLGIKPAGLWMLEFELDESYPNEGEASRKEEKRFASDQMIGLGLAIIEKTGWVSRSIANETGKMSTADRALNVLFNNPRTEEDRREKLELTARGIELQKEAKEILKYAKKIDGDSEYAENLRRLSNSETINAKNLPLLLSAISAKNRNDKKVRAAEAKAKMPKSEWVGNLKEKLTPREVFVENIRTIESNYGYSTTYSKLITMRDSGGNVYKTFYSGNETFKEGVKYNLERSTVKKHDEWNGDKSTLLSRIKLDPLEPKVIPPTTLMPGSPFAKLWNPKEVDKLANSEYRRLEREYKKKAGKDGWDDLFHRPKDSELSKKLEQERESINKDYMTRYEELTSDK